MRHLFRWSLGVLVLVVGAGLFAYLLECGPALRDSEHTPAVAPVTTATGERPVAGDRRPLRIGWTAWADAEVVTLMVTRLLEDGLGQPTERVMTDIGIQYQAVANGELDVMLMAWLPLTHANYWEKVRDKVINLGPLYTGRLGWAVPAYVPAQKLAAIPDLKDAGVARRLDLRIQGIDPGSGLMQASERAMQAYGLDNLRLVSSSGAAMTAVLDRAIRHGEWVVVTAWRPHWIFARYDLRFLRDPGGLLGGVQRVHALARRGIEADFPAGVIGLLSRLYLTSEALSAILLASQDASVEEAVDAYLQSHPRRVHYWLTGEIAEP